MNKRKRIYKHPYTTVRRAVLEGSLLAGSEPFGNSSGEPENPAKRHLFTTANDSCLWTSGWRD